MVCRWEMPCLAASTIMPSEFGERYTRENMYPIPNAGKDVTGVIRGKQILSVKRRKTCNVFFGQLRKCYSSAHL